MIDIVPETGSTNLDLLARLAAGEPIEEGAWLVARRQTAGLGRQGRAWFDGAGNFMGSTIVRLRRDDPPAPSVALMAGLAVQGAVARFLGEAGAVLLKWPNDALVAGAKIAGVLVQREGDAAVVGIGVNLARAPEVPGRATTDLARFACMPSLDDFAKTLAAGFAGQLALWRAQGLQGLRDRWMKVAHPVGTPLRVHGGDGAIIAGAFAGLAPDGALLLTLPDGTTRTIHAGDTELALPKG